MSKTPGKLIVIANVKGGTGKSTTAVNLAATAANDNKRVLIIDTDSPQFNAALWYAERVSSGIENVDCIQITTPTVQHAVTKHLESYDYVIVDSGARDTGVMRSAMIAAGKHKGILIIPLTTSPFDIWASIDTLGLLHEVRSMVDNIKVYFMLNRIITGTKLEKETKDALTVFEVQNNVPSLVSHIHQSVDMINCLKTGSSVIELNKKCKAAAEITGLYNEVNTILNGK
jgi:chromosome partitioning protein